MKRNKIFASLLLVIVALFTLASCSSKEVDKYENMASVTFVLNGGTFKNSDKNLIYYYNLEEGKSCKIKTPYELSPESKLTNGDKIIKGYYKDENFTQAWDFNNDVINAKEKITLYIKWGSAAVYDFAIYYKNKDNQDILLDKIVANEQTLKLNLDRSEVSGIEKKFASDGYTSLWEFEDTTGNKIASSKSGSGYNVDLTHPGGEESSTVKVYLNAIEGDWSVAKTVADLTTVRGKNIYLLNDIDCGGKAISWGDYKDNIFEGNGHTISNFTVGYNLANTSLVGNDFNDSNPSKNTAFASIFKNIENAAIRNVNFANASLSVRVANSKVETMIIAPLAYKANNSTISNVTFTVSTNITISPTISNCVVVYADANYSDNHAGIGQALNCTVENTNIILTKTEEQI